MQIQISPLLKKPTDLDLHCLQKQDISGFSRTRFNLRQPDSLAVLYIIHMNCILMSLEQLQKVMLQINWNLLLIFRRRTVYPVMVQVQLLVLLKDWTSVCTINYQKLTYNKDRSKAYEVYNGLPVYGPRQVKDVSLSLCEMLRFRSSYASTQFHQGLCCPLIYPALSYDSLAEQRMPPLDCVDTKPDSDFYCPHIITLTYLPYST